MFLLLSFFSFFPLLLFLQFSTFCFSLTFFFLSPVGYYDATSVSFFFLSFFFVAFIQRLTIFLSPPPPLCYFCGLQRKIKNIKERSCPSYRATTDLIDENEERRKDCRSYSLYEVNHFGRRFTDRCFFFFFRSDHVGLADEHAENIREHGEDPGSFASLLSQMFARFHAEK